MECLIWGVTYFRGEDFSIIFIINKSIIINYSIYTNILLQYINV